MCVGICDAYTCGKGGVKSSAVINEVEWERNPELFGLDWEVMRHSCVCMRMWFVDMRRTCSKVSHSFVHLQVRLMCTNDVRYLVQYLVLFQEAVSCAVSCVCCSKRQYLVQYLVCVVPRGSILCSILCCLLCTILCYKSASICIYLYLVHKWFQYVFICILCTNDLCTGGGLVAKSGDVGVEMGSIEIYLNIRVYIYIYVYMCIHEFIYICVVSHICIHEYICICTYLYIHVYTYN